MLAAPKPNAFRAPAAQPIWLFLPVRLQAVTAPCSFRRAANFFGRLSWLGAVSGPSSSGDRLVPTEEFRYDLEQRLDGISRQHWSGPRQRPTLTPCPPSANGPAKAPAASPPRCGWRPPVSPTKFSLYEGDVLVGPVECRVLNFSSVQKPSRTNRAATLTCGYYGRPATAQNARLIRLRPAPIPAFSITNVPHDECSNTFSNNHFGKSRRLAPPFAAACFFVHRHQPAPCLDFCRQHILPGGNDRPVRDFFLTDADPIFHRSFSLNLACVSFSVHGRRTVPGRWSSIRFRGHRAGTPAPHGNTATIFPAVVDLSVPANSAPAQAAQFNGIRPAYQSTISTLSHNSFTIAFWVNHRERAHSPGQWYNGARGSWMGKGRCFVNDFF